ncbi:hypothetical protein NSS66_25675 [Paenibacillus sp. FSL R10-2748]
MNEDLKEIGEQVEWRTGQTGFHHVFSLFFYIRIYSEHNNVVVLLRFDKSKPPNYTKNEWFIHY